MKSRFFRKIFTATFYQAEAEAETWRSHPKNKTADRKTIIICIVTAFCLTMNKYLGDSYYLWKIWSFFKEGRSGCHTDERLLELGWWVAVLTTFYFIVPLLLIKFLFREKLSDYGLRLKGAFANYHLYIVMLLVMIPLVFFFSGTASFQARYPFYLVEKGESLFPNFIIWEFLYFIQFAALEFFFRGFMVHGTKHRFGYYSVFVMTIPYCMIHFGKPLTETIAAVIAGIILGTLSLKSRSVLLGIAIHYSVAITMDIAALWQKGLW